MSKKGCLAITVVVIIIILILAVCGVFCVLIGSSFAEYDWATSGSENYKVVYQGGDDTIAVIPVEGVISDTSDSSDLWGSSIASSQIISDNIDKAIEDSNVKAIILNVNSPGGDVYASDIIYNKIKEAQAQGVKVVTLMRGTAASGGYYIAAPSDKIVANAITITGSIGVRMDFQSLAGLYEKLGIESRTITNSEGEYKTGEGLFDNDPSGEEDKIMQDIVDEAYDRFIGIIAEGRKMKENDVVELADGRILTGKQAKEAGLVDILGGFDEAVAAAEQEAGITNATVVSYDEYDFWSMLMGYVSNVANPTAEVMKLIDPTPGAKLRYIYAE
ncbi:MAG: signal peptide peptidase SppA [Candidatus Dojkabacteria bacterium]|nr:signal peptide peptidase SppA [Candidatus Dojkabacteria bacterium]